MAEMRFPAIEHGTESTAFGMVVHDLPGCFSAGDSLDETFSAAEEASAAWIDEALDNSRSIPMPSSPASIRQRADDAGWVFGVVTVDPALLDDTTERGNITLPRRVRNRVDAQARAAGESRSGYIAQLTLDERHHAA